MTQKLSLHVNKLYYFVVAIKTLENGTYQHISVGSKSSPIF